MKLVPYQRGFLSDGFFNNFFNDSWPSVSNTAIKADVKETEDSFLVEAEVPGVNKEDVTLMCERGVLTITVSKEEKKEEEKNGYIRRERYTGSSSRRFLFEDVDEENIKAKLDNGILTVTLPKSNVSKQKHIDIDVE
eukprot:Anaeramoba_ignava/a95224_30.p1 GENE.a95224_30~~a95224_30.p1  ORF type:complete len:137 (-),score=15.14 a95224_30:48-458(-)